MAEPGLIDRDPASKIDFGSPVAQVVTGIRRCGKSVLCRLALRRAGKPFGYVDFDDEALDGVAAAELDDLFTAAMVVYGKFDVLYLDEIQHWRAMGVFLGVGGRRVVKLRHAAC